MSMSPPDEHRQEIIIVKRGGNDDHDDHHGGVWKIAFADFMTAMMCFFLVMWLINAANEQTKMSVASYFNPVKLIDRNTNKKGLDDIGEGPESANMQDEKSKETTDKPVGNRRQLTGPAQHENSKALEETPRHSDSNLFSDPYAVLSEIAQETDRLQNVSDRGDGGVQIAGPASGASGGEAYRDPFAPDFWSQQVAEPKDGREGNPDDTEKTAMAVDSRGTAGPAPRDAAIQAEVEAMLSGAPEKEPAPATPDATSKLSETIKEELSREFGNDAALKASITVVAANDGVMISVMDEMKTDMFGIGSAVPNRELVLAMEKIGRTLAGHAGKVVINGHTDGRPFQGKHYDNWQLSTARAQAAFYMLTRAGLTEDRVESVAGFADRKLKVPADPLDASNRRIEIFLEPVR